MLCQTVKVTYERKTGKRLSNELTSTSIEEIEASVEDSVMEMLLDRMMKENIIPNIKRRID